MSMERNIGPPKRRTPPMSTMPLDAMNSHYGQYGDPPLYHNNYQPDYYQPDYHQPDYYQPDYYQPDHYQPDHYQPDYYQQPPSSHARSPRRHATPKRTKLAIFQGSVGRRRSASPRKRSPKRREGKVMPNPRAEFDASGEQEVHVGHSFSKVNSTGRTAGCRKAEGEYCVETDKNGVVRGGGNGENSTGIHERGVVTLRAASHEGIEIRVIRRKLQSTGEMTREFTLKVKSVGNDDNGSFIDAIDHETDLSTLVNIATLERVRKVVAPNTDEADDNDTA
ncbi:uncharacterized protein AB675_7025 [Cyphellophora attinorum]|uniref:Uncharacterized protein n=1 Tax=Cyphellophora attinorum TaxID=1664694 RepID=A0A0N1HE28_9EURO|nr:uncharacterized protein AB675_7025 [Phialophora attinorum]KPI43520.1 hypothetical protein AB675_7025 [Phialophora attinorum]